VLIGQAADDLWDLLYEKAKEIMLKLKQMTHFHHFISRPTTDAPNHFANQFKRFTSHGLRDKYTHIRSRLPILSNRSKYMGSVSSVYIHREPKE
jgi:REP element-mobilizing transposase RayT